MTRSSSFARRNFLAATAAVGATTMVNPVAALGDRSRTIQVNGISIYVEEHGRGRPVLLLHGWPDSHYIWRNQVPFLVANGFRVITPDLRGFGNSDRPEAVSAYSRQNSVADALGILDAYGISAADVVGHDWGAAVAWLIAASS